MVFCYGRSLKSVVRHILQSCGIYHLYEVVLSVSNKKISYLLTG